MNGESYIPEIPITLPTKEEKKWIKRSYNTGVGMVLLNFAIVNGVAMIMMIGLAVFKLIQTQMDIAFVQNYIMEVASSMTLPMVVINLVAALIAYPISIGVGFRCLKERIRDFLSTKSFTGKFLMLAVVVGLGAQMVGSYLAQFISFLASRMGYQLVSLDTSTKENALNNILMGVFACIVAPIVEELLFRGLLMKSLSKVSVRFGIVASAVLFGLYHGNIPQAVNAVLLGLVFGFVAFKAGSILPCIVMHFACNFNALLGQTIYYLCGDRIGSVVTGIMALAFILGTAVILFCYRKKVLENLPPKTPPQQKRRGWRLLLTSWTMIMFVVLEVLVICFTIKAV